MDEREFLLFRLHGPMASWGGIAAGELRPSEDHPGRSTILGLLAAALGIERGEQARHTALSRQLAMAVVVESAGVLMEDFHTTQTPDGTRGRDLGTRSNELAYRKLNTILSRRQYYCDAWVTVALWDRGEQLVALPELVQALNHPKWTLYLGRKSCPPGAPLEPRIEMAATLLEALKRTKFASDEWALATERRSGVNVYWDTRTDEDVLGFDTSKRVTAMRRDEPVHRQRWQFTHRQEAMTTLSRTTLKE